MAASYTGKVAHVNLSDFSISVEEIPFEIYRMVPGGSALATYLLLRDLPSKIGAYAPENILIFSVGPVTSLPIAGQSRLCVNAKSPLTGGIGDSQAGGYFAAQLKASGYDAIAVKGKSKTPVYLLINEDGIRIRPADHLWGKDTGQTQEIIRDELGDNKVEIAQIGPAGENLVRFASIMNMCSRANGRTGMGAVMGSKNLKAIAVRGHKRTKPVDQEGFSKLASQFKTRYEQNAAMQGLHQSGTAGTIYFQNVIGGLPTRNWLSGYFELADEISAKKMLDTILVDRDTCFGCGLYCKRVVKADNIDPLYGGPEYETLSALGSYCEVSDLIQVSKANELCNRYGMDTISCGAAISFAMECFEEGILSEKDTGGLDLRFGNGDAMVTMVEMIAKRKGFGDVLAEGSARAAMSIGVNASNFALTVKGNELPAHMPHTKGSFALIYAVNPFGPDHQSSDWDGNLTLPMDSEVRQRLTEMGIYESLDITDLSPAKVKFAYYTQILMSVTDVLCLCQFIWGPSFQMYGPMDIVELIRTGLGWRTSLWELMKIGERRINLQRAFNAREGLTGLDDVLPDRMFSPLEGGPTDGVKLDRKEVESAVRMYYRIAGWDVETGVPTRSKLSELGLSWVADQLEAYL